jgi:Fe2+ transport system protein FeoA
MKRSCKLSTLTVGSHAEILGFDSSAENQGRIKHMMEMGMTVGVKVEIAHKAPFGGSIVIHCRRTLIGLRISDASLVEVTRL